MGGITELDRPVEQDILYFYCVIFPTTCNLAYRLASYISSFKSRKVNSCITGGAFITRLVESFDIFTTKVRAGLTEIALTQRMGMSIFRDMHIVHEVSGMGYRLAIGWELWLHQHGHPHLDIGEGSGLASARWPITQVYTRGPKQPDDILQQILRQQRQNIQTHECHESWIKWLARS
ncbi:hypothetical protein L1987_74365 [Smallanthus sonchifolius]|uniref:Uncharacterized protein n=1 Tax=Smallanthus sonchifolius TaxID=185202 RepID=A0ACB9A2J1_9ASTR|nr:hypothetical protein L1987_74365 [Smallanthus sonchifolius]